MTASGSRRAPRARTRFCLALRQDEVVQLRFDGQLTARRARASPRRPDFVDQGCALGLDDEGRSFDANDCAHRLKYGICFKLRGVLRGALLQPVHFNRSSKLVAA
jgi:hypothetical protein